MTENMEKPKKKMDNVTWLKKFLKRKDINVATSRYIQSCIDEIIELRSTIKTVGIK